MPKLQPETVQQIADWYREGRSGGWIAATIGVHQTTLSKWFKRGREEPVGSVYRMLSDAVAAARREARNGGRPSKAEQVGEAAMLPRYTGGLTDEIRARLVSFLRKGRSLDDSSVLCGVDRSTPRRWIQRGIREGSGPYHDFALAIEQAQVHGKDKYETRIEALAQQNDHGPTALRATETILRTRYDDWAPPMQREPRQFVAMFLKAVEDEAYARGLPADFLDGVRRRVQRTAGRAPEPAFEADPVRALPVGE